MSSLDFICENFYSDENISNLAKNYGLSADGLQQELDDKLCELFTEGKLPLTLPDCQSELVLPSRNSLEIPFLFCCPQS